MSPCGGWQLGVSQFLGDHQFVAVRMRRLRYVVRLRFKVGCDGVVEGNIIVDVQAINIADRDCGVQLQALPRMHWCIFC